MRNAWTIAVIGAAVAVAASFVSGSKREAVAQAETMPAYQIVTVPPTPQYERGPRIIHVPQPGDERADVNERYEPNVTNDVDTDEPAPPPKPRRATPKPTTKPRAEIATKPQRRADAPPPPLGPQRAILSAPPPALAEGPTPIRPTPRYRSNAEPVDKFAAPSEPPVTPAPDSDNN